MRGDASDAVDAYLTDTYGIGLEQVLAEATAGSISLVLADIVKILCERVAAFTHTDGGISETFLGLLTVADVTYRFRCSVFNDAGGERFVADIEEFSALRWQTKLPLPRG